MMTEQIEESFTMYSSLPKMTINLSNEKNDINIPSTEHSPHC